MPAVVVGWVQIDSRFPSDVTTDMFTKNYPQWKERLTKRVLKAYSTPFYEYLYFRYITIIYGDHSTSIWPFYCQPEKYQSLEYL